MTRPERPLVGIEPAKGRRLGATAKSRGTSRQDEGLQVADFPAQKAQAFPLRRVVTIRCLAVEFHKLG